MGDIVKLLVPIHQMHIERAPEEQFSHLSQIVLQWSLTSHHIEPNYENLSNSVAGNIFVAAFSIQSTDCCLTKKSHLRTWLLLKTTGV